MKSGIRAATMDEIAKELGISKKTLYRHFNSRTDMIDEIVDSFIQSDIQTRDELTIASENSVDEMISMGTYNSKLFDILSPMTVPDLKQYYPEIWMKIFNFQKNYLQKQLFNNLERGISEGYYRSDLNPDFVSRFYVLLGLAIIEDIDLLSKPNTLKPMYLESLKYHLSGILSEKGRKEVKKYM
jgi:AcrR family transcriptional regulator